MSIFYEDFFERVINVAWDDEPEVYWMAATGDPLIVNGIIMSDQRSWLFTSDDGMNWAGQDIGHNSGPGKWGVGAAYAGCWMRQGLKKGAPPVWVIGGGDGMFQSASGSGGSDDAKTLSTWQKHDERHSVFNYKKGKGIINAESRLNFPNWHVDKFRSPDGHVWQPARRHKWTDTMTASVEVSLQAAAIPPENRPIPFASVVVPDGDLATARKLFVPQRRILLPNTRSSLSVVEPMAIGDPVAVKKADSIVFKDSADKAQGRVRVGDYAGKTLLIQIKPYNHYPEGGDHGDSTVEITDVTKDSENYGQSLGTANVGMTRAITIGYGHYVFVVGGGNAGKAPEDGGPDLGNGDTMISYSEDGVSWKAMNFGKHSQVNPVVVGPRPSDELRALHQPS